MKKKILFIAPDYYGFNEVVLDGLTKYSNCEIIEINSTISYKYKNIQERIYNFFLKIFTKKNLKKIKRGLHIAQTIQMHDEYDLLIINRPDVLQEKDLELALSRSKKNKAIFWDSIEKIPQQKEYINMFNEILSFDSADCLKYNFKKITNFYFAEIEVTNKNDFDVALLMTYDQRIHDAIKLFKHFELNNIKAKAKIFTYKSESIREKLPNNMEIINKIIPFETAYEYYINSKVILDIAHPHQEGISFRPFEALGLNKKVITTNSNIKNYDFYTANNIQIVEDTNNINIPNIFFEDNFIAWDKSYSDKYFIKNWVKTIIS